MPSWCFSCCKEMMLDCLLCREEVALGRVYLGKDANLSMLLAKSSVQIGWTCWRDRTCWRSVRAMESTPTNKRGASTALHSH